MNTPIPTDDLSDRMLLRGMMLMSGMILCGAFFSSSMSSSAVRKHLYLAANDDRRRAFEG
jgi:hypothetical protein